MELTSLCDIVVQCPKCMRIAIFHELPKKSGSRKSVDFMATILAKRHSVDLFYTDSKKTYSSKLPFKTYLSVFHPVIWQGNNPATRLYRDTIELLKLFFLHKSIAKKIREKKYDVVFIHGSFLTESPFLLLFNNSLKIYYAHAPNYTFIYEKVMGIPKIDRVRFTYEYIVRIVRRIIDKTNVRSADIILTNSFYTKNKISSFYGKKSKVAYLGVDTSIYKPLHVKKKYDFLFVGSYHPVDGYNLLHQALLLMKKKPSYKILAIEDEWIDDDSSMAKLYNSAKVVLCLAHGEPFGLVAIEAMSCGVPVIAVDEAGYKETVVNNKTGILIKRDPEELVKAINKLTKDKKRLRTYEKNSRETAVAKWSWKKSVMRIEQIMQRRVGLV